MKNNICDKTEKSHVELHLTTKGKDAETARNHLTRAVAQIVDLENKNGEIVKT
jgi:hypothetical protein